MSRAKKRKTQRKNETSRSSSMLWGGLAAVVVLLVGIFALSSQTAPVQTAAGDEASVSWRAINLTDARTGEIFALSDFEDRNVFVKIMSPF